MKLCTILLLTSLTSVVAMAQKPSSSVDYLGNLNWKCEVENKGGTVWTCKEAQAGQMMRMQCVTSSSKAKMMQPKMTLKELDASCDAVLPASYPDKN